MKNILSKKWIKYKNSKIKITKKDGKLYITNNSSNAGFILIPKLFKISKNYIVNFKGSVIDGTSCFFYIMNLKKNVLAEASLNSKTLLSDINEKNCIFSIKVLPYTKVVIEDISLNDKTDNFITSHLKNKILVISPSYPSLENKYLSGFVHSRLVAYKKAGLKFDLIVAHDYVSSCKYDFEGINVLRVPFWQLRNILQEKHYDKILIHFFDQKYANVLDACDLNDSELFLWVHGPETLYWDWPKFTTPYFSPRPGLNAEQINLFTKNDELIKRYNQKPNVKWIFVSNWIKNESEKLINIKFNNFEVIPNIIDDTTFNYIEKNPEDRKKVFFLRRFDNCDKYAIDVNVKCILELSRRECFNDMEFNIYGVGDVYETLVAPLRQFDNVHLYPKFYSHDEIAKIHKENGIALFATRYDAQGVSMCEAASSGLAVITSTNEAVMEFLPNDCDIFAETENYIEYADKIEKLYNNPEEYLRVSKRCHEEMQKKCSYESTVQKEIELFKKPTKLKKDYIIKHSKDKVLSIIIPSYNVEKYLSNTIETLLNIKNKNKVEIIVVNDGSADNTAKIAKGLMKKYNDKENSTIVLIDKENGGHGSTINEGVKIATGKYIRIIDGDDWVDSNSFDKLISILDKEDSDIVVTDYSEDRAIENIHIPKRIYSSMIPGIKYNFDDLTYEGYGFQEWGPILATSNFKAELLKNSKYQLSEKSFYVDMEFDFFSIIDANTITYYDLDIYRYYIGRVGQSISMESYMRNYKQHENVLLRISDILNKEKNLNIRKQEYVKNKIIFPMLKAHYLILISFLKSGKKFNEFEKRLKDYPEIYNNNVVISSGIRFHRKTKGIFIKINPLLVKMKRILKRR